MPNVPRTNARPINTNWKSSAIFSAEPNSSGFSPCGAWVGPDVLVRMPQIVNRTAMRNGAMNIGIKWRGSAGASTPAASVTRANNMAFAPITPDASAPSTLRTV